LHTLRLIERHLSTSVTSLRSADWLASDFHSWINSWMDCQTKCLNNLTVKPTVQPTVESTVGPTVRPTVRSIFKPCKCAFTLVGKLPVITGKTAWNWRRAVLSADAGLLVSFNSTVFTLCIVQARFSRNTTTYRPNACTCEFYQFSTRTHQEMR